VKAAVLLGLRLAIGTGSQRIRSVATAGATALGTTVLLAVWAIAYSQVGTTTAFEPRHVSLLIAGTIGMVALPVLVLVCTVARLSAGLRDRRLANLRLLGMTAPQTRVVSATEVGVASAFGTGAGVVLFFALTPLLAQVEVGGRQWTAESLMPPALGWIAVLTVIPVVSTLTASLPQHLSSRQALADVRLTDVRNTSLLRVVPLLVGFALCWATRSPLVDSRSTLPAAEVATILLGIALMALGTLLVVPVFVRLIAGMVLACGGGALATLTGRRLQSQPSGATRVISALMIGLFVVIAARAVLGAFFSTPQYVSAADHIEREQTAEVTTAPQNVASTESKLRAVEGVKHVASFPTLWGTGVRADAGPRQFVTVIVANCSQLSATGEELPGCTDDAVSLVGEPWLFDDDADAMAVRATHKYEPQGRAVIVATDNATTINADDFERAVGALSDTPAVVVPPDTPGIAALVSQTDSLVVAHAGPGRDLYDRVEQAGLSYSTSVDIENYDFVQAMLTLVWTLAAVILGIGLLTFAIAGTDRALNRRRELTALRLIGTPGSILRRAQWLEVALPTVLGSVFAIVTGAYAGATYLQLDEDKVLPMTETLALAGAAAAISMILALITVLGTAPRLNAEHIRAE
jgi:putative ABC transport system permease protein